MPCRVAGDINDPKVQPEGVRRVAFMQRGKRRWNTLCGRTVHDGATGFTQFGHASCVVSVMVRD